MCSSYTFFKGDKTRILKIQSSCSSYSTTFTLFRMRLILQLMGTDPVLANDAKSVLYSYSAKRDVIFLLIKYMSIVIFCHSRLKNMERAKQIFHKHKIFFNNDLVYRIVRREPILQRPILIRFHNHILVFLSVKIPEGTLLETRELICIVDLSLSKVHVNKMDRSLYYHSQNAFTFSLKPMLLYYFNRNIKHLTPNCFMSEIPENGMRFVQR